MTDKTAPNMSGQEAVQMMQLASSEIKELRRQIDRIAPKAEAYDNLAAVLNLLPGPSRTMGEDVAWRLDKRIEEMRQAMVDASQKVTGDAQ